MKSKLFIPANFQQTILELYGERGQVWLAHLPELLVECERRWQIQVQPAFEPLSYNYVAPAVRQGGALVVLKAGVPNRELSGEIAALRLFDGDGIVQLLDGDAERGVMLLERILPGTPLAAMEDDAQATVIAAQVMRHLWRPAPAVHSFPTVADWAAGFQRLRQRYDGGSGPLDARLVAQAERLFAELLASQTKTMLLHGDFHHWNVLSAERQPWLALDPKGLVGDPGYEVGQLLLNHLDWSDHVAVLRCQRRRLDQLAELLEYDRERLRCWGMAQATLSGWWSLEDHGHGWEEAFACVEILEQC